MGQEGSLYVHCTRVYSYYILHMKVWIWFCLSMWSQVLYKLQGGALLSSLPAIAIYLQQSFLTQLHLIRCHVMCMIYEYDLSTSQIRWSGKQVNSLDSEDEFICLWYCFLSKVLYLKCWSKFSRTLTFSLTVFSLLRWFGMSRDALCSCQLSSHSVWKLQTQPDIPFSSLHRTRHPFSL